MSRFMNKKSIVVVGVAFLLASAGAYAYWTQLGSGDGSAATGTGSAITINQTSVISGLSPASTPQTLSGTYTNPNPGSVYVGTITATLTSVTGGGVVAPLCTIADYQITNPAIVVNATVAAGTGGAWTGPTIKMLDAATNQDSCKGATVNIHYASN